MNKNILKTSLVAISLFAFGFLMINQAKAADTQVGEAQNAEVTLEIEEGNLTPGTANNGYEITGGNISGTIASLNLGTGKAGDVLSGQYSSDAAFYVSDLKGSASGWYTTISVTDLIGQTVSGAKITKDHVFFMTENTAPKTITGSDNEKVIFDNGLNNYQALNGALTYMKRATGTDGANILGVYGDNPRIKVEIPQFTPADQYKGVITYTLYEYGVN